ncbi:hypothetical protein [Bacillus paranthracis]|uniref:Uncharacterized protein n=1 Tax=Bacillus paranthracis TaxID=2026186 RepID=A0AAJ1K9G4_9BACI|nr:hypothetical protein [Bacillus paranthracis]MDG0949581.1 hypothetical protein [Bacillus paranthracis]MDG0955244.1 hypothetical protein [Bacillus paranthracis]
MSFINSFFEKKAEPVQRLFFDIRFLLFGFTLISSLGFLIIYSFLYGYYFSGDEFFQISNFNIVSNLIPFSIQTLTITSIFFICIYYIISASIPLMRKNKEQTGVIFILLVLIIFLLNWAITMFFANEITIASIASFLLIWGFMGLIIWFLFMMPKILEHPFVTLNSVIFQFFLSIILLIVLQFMGILEENEISDYISVTFIPAFLFITTIFHKLYKKKGFNLISCLPYSFIISIPVVLLLTKIYILNHFKLITWIVVIIIIHPIVLIITKFIENRWVNITKSTTSKKTQKQFGEVQNQPIEKKVWHIM